MLIDITLKITPSMAADAQGNEKKALVGHLGTHFDAMGRDFPLDYFKRRGLVFDVSHVEGRDIDVADLSPEKIKEDAFVLFYTGYIERVPYGSREYFSRHPQLSHQLIDLLLARRVSLIGVDFAGVRRGPEHPPTDQRCADQGVFIIENLRGLDRLLPLDSFTVYTLPMSYAGMTGLPCRVVAESP